MKDGVRSVDLNPSHVTIADLIVRAEASGMTLREHEGMLNMSRSSGPPNASMEHRIRQNRDMVTQAVRLQQRLTTGWHKCEMETDPERKAGMEEYWLGLLNEYEMIARKVAR